MNKVHILIFVISFIAGFGINNEVVKNRYYNRVGEIAEQTLCDYFENNTDRALEGYKLDLPEEISQINDQHNSQLDLLTAYKDTNTGVIHLGFTNMQIVKDNYHFITEHSEIPDPLHNMREYQMELDSVNVTIWDYDRFVTKLPYSKIGKLDSVFLKDNL